MVQQTNPTHPTESAEALKKGIIDAVANGGDIHEVSAMVDEFYQTPVAVVWERYGIRKEARTRKQCWLVLPDKPSRVQKLIGFIALRRKSVMFVCKKTISNDDTDRLMSQVSLENDLKIFKW